MFRAVSADPRGSCHMCTVSEITPASRVSFPNHKDCGFSVESARFMYYLNYTNRVISVESAKNTLLTYT